MTTASCQRKRKSAKISGKLVSKDVGKRAGQGRERNLPSVLIRLVYLPSTSKVLYPYLPLGALLAYLAAVGSGLIAQVLVPGLFPEVPFTTY